MRNRTSREQAIAILEELSFNATYWDSENNGPDPEITDEIWITALLIEQLYQIMESRKQSPYFIADVPEPERSSTGDILEKILTKEFRSMFKQPPYQLHGFLEIFHKTVYELQYRSPVQHDRSDENQPIKLIRGPYLNIFSLTPPISGQLHNNYMIFFLSLNRLYARLYHRTLQKDACTEDLPTVAADLEFGKKYRQEQTQLISRTGRTCKSAITYFDQLLEQHGKLVIVSLSLCRNIDQRPNIDQRRIIETMQYQALISEWKKFLQNGRNSHPMMWNLGFLAGIRATSQKGLYIQVYFFFDAEQADPKDLEHAVGNYWVRTTNGRYHATPITCVKKFKYKSVYEISSKDQVGINLLHNRIIPSLTKARLFVTPLAVLNEKQASNSKTTQTTDKADVFLRGELPATRPKGKLKKVQTEVPDDQESS